MASNDKFYIRIWHAINEYKKDISILLIWFALLIEAVPTEIHKLSPEAARSAQLCAILFVAFVCLNVLFEILSRTKESNKRIPTIEASGVLANIYRLVDNESDIRIKYIAVAGQTGWGNVLAKFLDKFDSHSLLQKKSVVIEVALIDESVLDILEDSRTRYSSVLNTVEEINKTQQRLTSQGNNNVTLTLMRYKYMPNTIGFLINENYLFTAPPYWEIEDGTEKSFVLRGGRRQHLIYDKNDGFGGEYYIQKFMGWFEYIKSKA